MRILVWVLAGVAACVVCVHCLGYVKSDSATTNCVGGIKLATVVDTLRSVDTVRVVDTLRDTVYVSRDPNVHIIDKQIFVVPQWCRGNWPYAYDTAGAIHACSVVDSTR